MNWQQLEETLTLLAHVLSVDSAGNRTARLAPPIAADIEQAADEWLARWAETGQPMPLPEGDVRAACFARVYCAVTFAGNATAHGIPMPAEEFFQCSEPAVILRRMLVEGRPQLAKLWAICWQSA